MKLEDCPTLKLNNITLQGHSRSAEQTCFYIHELKIMLDGGMHTDISPKTLLLTHTHTDHCYFVPKIMYPNYESNDEKLILAPYQSVPSINKFIDSIKCLENCNTSSRFNYNYNIIGTNIDTKYKINNNYLVETIECIHGIPCLGYGIFEQRKKLKTEYDKFCKLL